MHRPPVKIGVLEADKDATSCFLVPLCKRPGAEIEILQMAFRILGDPFHLVLPFSFPSIFPLQVDVASSFNVTNDLGEWVEEGAIDMSGVSMRMTSDRRREVLFSYPTRFFQSIFVIAKPFRNEQKAFIFSAFSQGVWICLAAVFTVAFFTQLIHVFVRRRIRRLPSTGCCNPRTTVLVLLTAFNKTFRAPLHAPLLSQAVYGVVFVLSLFIVTQVYISLMATILSSPIKVHVPLNNVDSALDAVESGSMFFSAYPRQSFLCSSRSNCHRFKEVIALNQVRRRTTEQQISDDLNNGGIYQATIDSEFLQADVSFLDSRSRTQIAIRDDSGPEYFGAYAFNRRRRKLRDRFNHALMSLYPSIAQVTTGHGYETRKVAMNIFTPAGISPLTLFHLRQLFLYFIIALLVSSVVFSLETLLHILASRCPTNPRIIVSVESGDSPRETSEWNSILLSIQFNPTRRDSFVI